MLFQEIIPNPKQKQPPVVPWPNNHLLYGQANQALQPKAVCDHLAPLASIISN